MGVLCSGTCFGAWCKRKPANGQHWMELQYSVVMWLKKSLSGEGMSEGFTAGGSIPHPETPNPQEMSCKMVLCCFFSVPWPHFIMLNKFQVHKRFNLASFLLFFVFFFPLQYQKYKKRVSQICRVRPHILSVQPVLFFGKILASHSGNNYHCKLVS